VTGPPEIENATWSYAAPFPSVGKIAGMVAFYNDLVDVAVDGVTMERPVSVFSQAGNRPGSQPT
jgi:hypothetical protein